MDLCLVITCIMGLLFAVSAVVNILDQLCIGHTEVKPLDISPSFLLFC